MELGSICTAMVTPFTSTGAIDFRKTAELIEHLIQSGTESLVVCGTTGESPTLTKDEKDSLISYTIEKVNNRIPVIAGTGTNSTAESIIHTKAAERLGADGVMLVVPFYNKPNQQGLFAHFSAIAAETTLPILLYNIPGRSAVNMTAETVIALSKIKNIRAMKEASGDLEQMASIVEGTDDDFSLYSGDDGLTLPLMAIGGKGIVSVASHIVGLEIQQMINAFQSGRLKEAAAMHRSLLPLFNALFKAPNPVPLKYALNKIGMDCGSVRLPLVGYGAQHDEFDELWKQFQQKTDLFQ